MKPFVFYADGSPVRPADRVLWNGEEYDVLALWVDPDDGTNVSLYLNRPPDSPYPRMPRVNSRDLTRVMERVTVPPDRSVPHTDSSPQDRAAAPPGGRLAPLEPHVERSE